MVIYPIINNNTSYDDTVHYGIIMQHKRVVLGWAVE